MPTYEYQCKSCNHRFEIWQKMTDDPLTVCPECQGAIRRVLYPAGIVFKGSGFYKTDHGNGAVVSENHHENHGDQKEAAKKEETATTKGSETKSSSEKPAATKSEKTAAAAD